MNIQESQLNYLHKRKKSYNLKYSILKTIIQNNLFEETRVLELFGGVGLTTGLIQEIKPSYHEVLEIDDACLVELKRKFKNIEIIKANAFNYKNFKNFSWIFLDVNGYTLKRNAEFEVLFNNIHEFNPFAELILTETGVFNLQFKRKANKYQEHFDNLNNFFNIHYGFFIKKAYYTKQFSILCIQQKPCSMEIIPWKQEDDCWRKYL